MAGEPGGLVNEVSETREVVEMADELSEMVGDRSETRIGEVGEVAGRQFEGLRSCPMR